MDMCELELDGLKLGVIEVGCDDDEAGERMENSGSGIGGGAGGNGSTGGLSGGTGAVTDHLFASSFVLKVIDENQAGRCKGSSRNFQQSHGSRNRNKRGRFSSRVCAGVLEGFGFPATISQQPEGVFQPELEEQFYKEGEEENSRNRRHSMQQSALQHHHHQQMAAAWDIPIYKVSFIGRWGIGSPTNGKFENPFLPRQPLQPAHSMDASVANTDPG
ncbi:hypothetical protein SADUNF_Sadunf19G0075600 [Salix dunnii]|uniref:Uncharacterized protein n=1 Tax=Salix dunnii TaxID=1413687 RepID=A0A835IYX3_9ROSI|nr:hypothetical protein SADUNF_Sadunf19G0075600 [Salix dunnii]